MKTLLNGVFSWHFSCKNSLTGNLSHILGIPLHEVASQVGHSNVHTTLLYTNPSIEEIKNKSNLL